MARPLVGVYTSDEARTAHVPTPVVLTSPIRKDVVQDVHTMMAKNKRQPYAVSKYAGHQTSAESWGTGRAVARIPRVAGGGTHRSGQGAFGNMCRKGRMFAPTKVWRRWHRKINVNQKRFATCSAIAASAIPSLVLARGHKIEKLPEIPLVVDSKAFDGVDKSKAAVTLLKNLKAWEDVEKVKDSRKIRPGHGKWRNRRYVQRKGPLVVYNEKGSMLKALRNLPGVELCSVDRLNLLQLAPGGHLGRFIIWTKDAFEKLDKIFGTYRKRSSVKKGFSLPRASMTNPDLHRILRSDAVTGVLRERHEKSKPQKKRKNPLKNVPVMARLNPYAKEARRQAILRQRKSAEKNNRKLTKEELEAAKKVKDKKRQLKKENKAFYSILFPEAAQQTAAQQ